MDAVGGEGVETLARGGAGEGQGRENGLPRERGQLGGGMGRHEPRMGTSVNCAEKYVSFMLGGDIQ